MVRGEIPGIPESGLQPFGLPQVIPSREPAPGKFQAVIITVKDRCVITGKKAKRHSGLTSIWTDTGPIIS